jgi:hypothetical protein
MFHSRTGGKLNASNLRNRLLNGTPPRAAVDGQSTKAGVKGLVQRVNEKRAVEGRMLLPDRVTPHTFATHVREPRTCRRPRPALGHGTDGSKRRASDAAGHATHARRRGTDLAAHAVPRRARRDGDQPNHRANAAMAILR